MKEFFGKLLFVLAIVGIIATANLLWPNPANDTLSNKPSAEAESTEPEPEPE